MPTETAQGPVVPIDAWASGFEEEPNTLESSMTQLVAGPVEASEYTLMLLEGAASGRTWSIHPGLALGRDASCDITVIDESVSRRHAVFGKNPEGAWVIQDLVSKNGTFVNGEAVVTQVLGPGDHIRLGKHSTFRFSRADELHSKLAKAQRLESVGRLAGGMAHDYNNLMMVISANVDFLDEVLDSPEVIDRALVRSLVADVRLATSRATQITRQLLDFGRGGSSERAILDLGLLCAETVRMAQMVMPKDVEVKLETAPGVLVEGDEGPLSQVVLNLCVNAGDAMPEGGTLTLRVRKEVAEDPAQGHVAFIEVVDTGTGMSQAVQDRIFEPFYTTKSHDSGTGLGLAMSYGIVRKHGGGIAVSSVVGHGSQFTVRLPARANLRLPHDLAQVTVQRNAEFQGLVLVVDDSPLVRRTSQRLLNGMGILSMQASSGEEMLQMCQHGGYAFDVILLDLSMRSMDGLETLSALRVFDRTTPVVVCTSAKDFDLATLRRAGAQGLVLKPYDASILAKALDEVGAVKSTAGAALNHPIR